METIIRPSGIQSKGDCLTTTYVDLRSDTVTKPTPAMRRAIADAEVGDDVFAGDPTVRRLEEETAALLGKEAALFVPTGCMGNEISVAVQTKRGDRIALDPNAHFVYVESRALVELMGRRFHFLEGSDRGRLDPAAVRGLAGAGADVAGPADGVAGPIALVEVENTFNWRNGAVYSLERLRAVREAAASLGLPIHLDGARLWNASAASGVPLADYAACADSVMVCYSKGLGAPIGSAVAGSAAFVAEARATRKMFGGAMRQVGVLAAGALHALHHHRDRIGDDHRRARRLAEAIAEIPAFTIDPREIETNIVIASAAREPEKIGAFVSAVERRGVLVLAFGGPGAFRAITHLDVDDTGIERAVVAFREAADEVWGRAA
ncbi:MAG TPA: GntG family PLP-dependent aldolase [Candidatus Eisenbacteria bacterium]|nr:GntG family PLP-dependent aldolase [Candidatus Eisenbacteria bacterium]